MTILVKRYDEFNQVVYDRYAMAKVISTERIANYRHLNYVRNLRRERLLELLLQELAKPAKSKRNGTRPQLQRVSH